MRPVNLIPVDERRGAARAPGASTGVRVYILLGALGAALLCVVALVLTSNKINSRTQELAEVQAKGQGVNQVADALRPYGQFADLQQARHAEIAALASSRFDWERSLRQLSHAIPSNAWIIDLAATLSPKVEVEGGGAGGGLSNIRDKTEAPAFAITGCTFSHHAVARMMVRMQNLDDVTAVRFAKSARRDEADTGGGSAAPQAANDQQAATQETQDCVGTERVTKFDILVVFGGASGAGGTTTADAGGVPTGAAQQLAKAQGAAQTGQAASAGAASTSGGTP